MGRLCCDGICARFSGLEVEMPDLKKDASMAFRFVSPPPPAAR